jgi:hypothetical protein
MISDHGQHYDGWDLFAIGALDESERAAMASHLASGCEECQRAYSAALAVVAGLASLSPEEQLPPGAEARLRQRLTEGGQSVSTSSPAVHPVAKKWPIPLIAAWSVAAALLILVAVLGVRLKNTEDQLAAQRRSNAADISRLQQDQARDAQENAAAALRAALASAEAARIQAEQQRKNAELQVSQLQARVQDLETQLKSAAADKDRLDQALQQAHLQLAKAEGDASIMRQIAAQNDQITTLLQAVPLSQADLKPADGAKASARVFWQDDLGLLLVARDLPPLPQGKSFQLWFYEKDPSSAPVNVGVIQTASSGRGLLFVPPSPALRRMTGALITEETQEQGVSAPGKEILKVKP